MFQIFRFVGRRSASQYYSQTNGVRYVNNVCPVLFAQTKFKSMSSSVSLGGESHDERNMRLKRPQSPHLTIYKPQLTALLSITQRATGIILSSYFIALGVGAILLPLDVDCYVEEIECLELGGAVISGIKFLLALPVCYHFCNGLRHLVWDTGALLGIGQVYATGYLMLVAAFAAAAALALVDCECDCEEPDPDEEEI